MVLAAFEGYIQRPRDGAGLGLTLARKPKYGDLKMAIF
jgi:hypothetical protein